MTILFVTDHYIPTVNGIVSHIIALRAELQRRGHRVFILTTKRRNRKREKDVFYVPSIPFPLRPTDPISLPFYPRLENKLAKLPIDIVHSHLFITGYVGMRIADKRNIPSVVTLHTLFRDYMKTLPPANKETLTNVFTDLLARRYFNRYNAIIAPSQKAVDALKKINVKPPVHLIPNGIDLKSFQNNKLAGKEFVTDKTAPTIVITGRIDKGKNVDVAIQSIQHIKKQIPNIQLLIVGDGPQRHKIEKLISTLHVENNVKITGFVDQETVASLTNASDLFLFTSSIDTHPLAVIEAIACGKPVVAVKNPALSEIVSNGKNGIITTKNPKAIAKAITTILLDKKMKLAYGKYSKELAKHFSIASCADQIEKLYAQVIEEKRVVNNTNNDKSLFDVLNIPKSLAYMTVTMLLLLAATMMYTYSPPVSAYELPKGSKISGMVQKIKTEVKNSFSDYMATYSAN